MIKHKHVAMTTCYHGVNMYPRLNHVAMATCYHGINMYPRFNHVAMVTCYHGVNMYPRLNDVAMALSTVYLRRACTTALALRLRRSCYHGNEQFI